MPSLGAFIRKRRSELGLTQEELADRVGGNVRQADISRLENDRVALPRRQRLEAIARALDVPTGVLLARSGWQGADEIDAEDERAAAQRVGQQAQQLAEVDGKMSEHHEAIHEVFPDLVETVSQVHELVQQAEDLLDATKQKIDRINEGRDTPEE